MTDWGKMSYRERSARHAEIARQRLAEKERIDAMKEATERQRAEREAYWLARERPPLGGAKRRKPLSRMPA